MKRCRSLLVLALSLVLSTYGARGARADDPPKPAASVSAPDESILGTVEVDGSGTASLPPLPELAVVPLITASSADSMVTYVLRRDLELSGQFHVQALADAPPGPFTRDAPVDLAAFASKGAEYVVRTFAEPGAGVTRLIAEAYLAPKPGGAPTPAGADPPKPAYRGIVEAKPSDLRQSAHRLVDGLLGALTGRAGGFASQMTYASRVGRWRQAYILDSDGFNLHVSSPVGATVVSPVFGYGGALYYAISVAYSPFQLAAGPVGSVLPMALPGSVLGVAFSADERRAALATMSEGKSSLWIADAQGMRRVDAAPLANHPALGPLGKLAYVGGRPVQRVYIDGKPVSPPGLMASAPVFCDGPEGLLVVFSVTVAGGSDIVAMDTGGGRIRRLTQRQGENTDPACSPDGRLVAFFSDTKSPKSSGLFVMPVARPWLAKKVAEEVGAELHWSRALR